MTNLIIRESRGTRGIADVVHFVALDLVDLDGTPAESEEDPAANPGKIVIGCSWAVEDEDDPDRAYAERRAWIEGQLAARQ